VKEFQEVPGRSQAGVMATHGIGQRPQVFLVEAGRETAALPVPQAIPLISGSDMS